MIIKRDNASRGLTREELLALPAAVDLETANRALFLNPTTGYDLAKRGRYPCTILRLGNAYRVVTADLLKLLHIDVRERPSIEEPTIATPEVKTDSFASSRCCCCACDREGGSVEAPGLTRRDLGLLLCLLRLHLCSAFCSALLVSQD